MAQNIFCASQVRVSCSMAQARLEENVYISIRQNCLIESSYNENSYTVSHGF
jgi:hypothetical protein